jgi:transcriptional regulator GlxA family with amidase domain
MSFESLLPVKTVIERQSTRNVTPSAQLVERATSYIRRNALKGIGAVDVVRHLGVSRRLADVRFRQATGQSILSAIMKTRLDEVKRRLRDTDMPIAKITAACGFHGENYAKKLFKSRFGVSMTKWRAQRT